MDFLPLKQRLSRVLLRTRIAGGLMGVLPGLSASPIALLEGGLFLGDSVSPGVPRLCCNRAPPHPTPVAGN